MASFYKELLMCMIVLAPVGGTLVQADDGDGSVDGGAGCPRIRIVSRSGWNATSPTETTPLGHPISQVIICHTETYPCMSSPCAIRVWAIQRYHKNNYGWSDIGYNFLVGEDGRVYEGRGWDAVGAHARGYNNVSIGIAFIGNFNDKKPNNAALNAAKQLISCGILQGKLSCGYTLYRHSALTRSH